MEGRDQQVSPQQTIQKHAQTHVLVIVTLFLMLLSGIVGFLIGVRIGENTKNQISSEKIVPITTTTQQPIPTVISLSPISAPTIFIGDWKTFTSSLYSASFKYPSNWTYTSPASGPESFQFLPNIPMNDSFGNKIAFVMNVSFYDNDYSDDLINKSASFYTNATQESIVVGALRGVHIEGFVNKTAGEKGGEYILNKNGKTIEFKYGVFNGHSYGQEAEQMMKSLVFQSK